MLKKKKNKSTFYKSHQKNPLHRPTNRTKSKNRANKKIVNTSNNVVDKTKKPDVKSCKTKKIRRGYYDYWIKKLLWLKKFAKTSTRLTKISERTLKRFTAAKFFKYRRDIGFGNLPPLTGLELETINYQAAIRSYYGVRKLKASSFRLRRRRFLIKKKKNFKRSVFKSAGFKPRRRFHSMQSMIYPIIPIEQLYLQQKIANERRLSNLARTRKQLVSMDYTIRKPIHFEANWFLDYPPKFRDPLQPSFHKFPVSNRKKAKHLKIRPYSMIMPWLDFAQIHFFFEFIWPRVIAFVFGDSATRVRTKNSSKQKKLYLISMFTQDVLILAWDRMAHYELKRFIFGIRNIIYKRFYNSLQIREGIFGKHGLNYALFNYGQMFIFLIPLLSVFKSVFSQAESMKFNILRKRIKTIMRKKLIRKYRPFFKQIAFSITNFTKSYTDSIRMAFSQYGLSSFIGLTNRKKRSLNFFMNFKFNPFKTFSTFFELRGKLKRKRKIPNFKRGYYLRIRRFCIARAFRNTIIRNYLPMVSISEYEVLLNFYEIFNSNIFGPMAMLSNAGHSTTEVYGFAPYAV